MLAWRPAGRCGVVTLPSVTPAITGTGELGAVELMWNAAKHEQQAKAAATEGRRALVRKESPKANDASVHRSINTFVWRQVQPALRLSLIFVIMIPADLGSVGASAQVRVNLLSSSVNIYR